jgi:hypothetical protein
VQLIFGEEITLAGGRHLIALGIREEIRARTLEGALREIRAVGGVSVVPHPFKKGSGIFASDDEKELKETRRLVGEFADAIEVCNSKLRDRDNERAFALARVLQKAVTAGSDAHFGYDVGDAVLEVEEGTPSMHWQEMIRRGGGARVLMNRFVRQRLVDEHLTDTRINNLLPSIRRLVPKRIRMALKQALHRKVYQPRVRQREFALQEVRF